MTCTAPDGTASDGTAPDGTARHALAPRVPSVDTLIRALDAVTDGLAVVEVVPPVDDRGAPSFRLHVVNRAGCGPTDREDLLGRDPRSLFAPAAGERVLRALAAVADGGEVRMLRVPLAHSAAMQDLTVRSAPGPGLLVASWRAARPGPDIAPATDDDTGAMRVLLQTALDATSDAFAVYRVHRDGRGGVVGTTLMVINQAGARPLPGEPEELVGQDLREFFPRAVGTGLWDALVRAVTRSQVQYHRVDDVDDDGAWIASFDNTIAPASDDLVVVTWRDVSDIVRRTRELADLHAAVTHSATHDDLTGVANRSLLLQRTEAALARAARAGATVGLVFVDLDRFKEINDSLGHQAGDALLRAVAARLESVVRADDCVARFGGDEFVLLLSGMPSGWVPDDLLRRLMERLREPVDLGRGLVTPSASVGVALCPPADADVEALLKQADLAMYESKRAGRCCVTLATGEGTFDRLAV